MAELRVYGWNHVGRYRRIIAAKSRAEAARLSGTSDSTLKTWGNWTGNAAEIALANSRPGVTFEKPTSLGGKYAPVEKP